MFYKYAMALVFCQNTNILKIEGETYLQVKGGPSSSGFKVGYNVIVLLTFNK